MNPDTVAVDYNADDNIEMHHIVATHNNLKQGNHTGGHAALVMSDTNKPEGLFQRLIISLDEHRSVKLLMRQWGPRLEFVVRLMLLATFFDDSFRMVTHFSELTKQIGERGCLQRFATMSSPALVSVIATAALGTGLLAQCSGAICLLALLRPNGATAALIAWSIAQPVLYAQLSNTAFVAESLSLVGGLLTLRAHLVSDRKACGAGARAQLVGRLLLPAMYIYYAGRSLFSALTLDETSDLAVFISSLSIFVINMAVLIGLVIGSMLVAAGFKSRLVALLLAFVNLGYVFYQYPFFRFLSFKGGEWKVDEDNMWMPHVALPNDVTAFDFDPWQIYDLHRYYFFLGVSVSGSLLLLSQFGPGDHAAQKDEVLLPIVSRAQD